MFKRNVFIIHGSYGEPNENWFPWLKDELTTLNFEVIIPMFPTPDNQSLFSWREVFYEHISKLNKDSLIIGHSLGPAFILDILQSIDFKIFGAFMVVPFTGLLYNPAFDKINHSFTVRDFNWEKIKSNCSNIYTYFSDNDPYVPQSKSIIVSNELNAIKKIISNAGHFNSNAGYTTFEVLLNDIKQCCKL